MQLTKFLPIVLAATALATPFTKRDSAEVIQKLGVVSDKVKALNESITAFDGDLIKALAVQQGSDAVKTALNQTTAAADASEPFPDEEAVNIGAAVQELSPDVTSTLDNLKGKKETFDSSDIPLSGIVAQSLKDQKQATVDLTAAIVDKVSEDLKTIAQSFVQPILDKFDEVIAVYDSGSPSIPSFPTGGFSFPTGFARA